MKKCIYCKREISDLSVIDFCDKCGIATFGDKMFYAIVKNMKEAGLRGDLDQGRFWPVSFKNILILEKLSKMLKRKPIKAKGKIRLSEYFEKFKVGDRVAIKRELSVRPKFPKRLQGRSGIVSNKKGKSYIVKINDFEKEKTYIIHPVHLRKLKWY